MVAHVKVPISCHEAIQSQPNTNATIAKRTQRAVSRFPRSTNGTPRLPMILVSERLLDARLIHIHLAEVPS